MTLEYEIWRGPRVSAATGEAKTTRHLRIRQGLFPRPIRLGPRSVGFLAGWVLRINAARAAGKTDDEIRQIVAEIEASRSDSAPADNPATNPKFATRRAEFWADVRAGKRPHPRSQRRAQREQAAA